ncbi:MAG TPA: 3-deoxy-8-phosphooctulonate synthase, partial [Dongiaceae bacterium]
MSTIRVGNLDIANHKPMVMIGGMNVLEDRDTAFRVAEAFCEATRRLGMPYIFKASFDKANRSSIHSFRGPGLDEGLKLLGEIKSRFG